MRFKFAEFNNKVEYEALIFWLNICYKAGTKILAALSNSQLIVGKVNGEFEVKDESMKTYL